MIASIASVTLATSHSKDQNALAETKGTALTIVNCIGLSITIISIQLINMLNASWNPKYVYIILAIGPILGLIALYEKKN